MKIYKNFFSDKTVIVTGHTGFKGSWLCFILFLFGAKVIGISSYDLGQKSNYKILKIKSKIFKEYRINITNLNKLKSIIIKTKPDIIFHLAAQALVSDSYFKPVETFNTNINGTINILESIRYLKKKCSAVIITSDKCYLNKEIRRGYSEKDVLGGDDPYSASKASAEIIFNSYFKSFFKNNKYVSVVTARAGNVIGGGDFSINRIIPDAIRSISRNETLKIRSPKSTRPWQHVFEPLRGYIDLSINLYKNSIKSGESFNFGPKKGKNYSVLEVVNIIKKINPNLKTKIDNKKLKIKESGLLKLNCNKASEVLGWKPYLSINRCIKYTMDWYLCFMNKENIEILSLKQVNNYFAKK